MENKYYTPSIDNIRIGYECEITYAKDLIGTEGEYFFKYVIDRQFFSEGDYVQLRTPYLTGEGIKNEGWSIMKKSDNNYIYATKGMSELRYDISNATLAIYNTVLHNHDEYIKFPAFYGGCPSINEFRQIIKLLGI